MRLKDKFWFIRLSPSHKVFHKVSPSHKVDKTIPSLEELKNKVPVIEIKDVLIGKDCPHVKDIKSKKMTHPYVFSMVLDTPEPSTLDFVAPDEQTYEYWLDGINALLDRPLVSKEPKNDLDMLLAIEFKLQTLELEGIEIPEELPVLPPEPETYEFYFQ
ncbi:hypothetical protein QYM36_015400 [Artemia franciscana]|uniref:PH domain-containing protein n=1 Tax=Artemia franciscana TaxID=6661 RepID=A0AA88HHP5_ARTSF|nr:hypothetical protein QYM36_015400 [Artemia franciscana]